MSDRVRVTFEIPKTLLEFIDDVCTEESTEIMKLTRSSYLRKLIIEDRDERMNKNKNQSKSHLKWELPKENITNNQDDYSEFLNLSGYRR